MIHIENNFFDDMPDSSLDDISSFIDNPIDSSIDDNDLIIDETYPSSSIETDNGTFREDISAPSIPLVSEFPDHKEPTYEHIDFDEHGDPTMEQYHPSFGNSQSAGHSPHEDSDGFVHKGRTTLDTMGGRTDSFEHYVKSGSDYVKDHAGHYVKISGPGVKVNINGVDYEK